MVLRVHCYQVHVEYRLNVRRFVELKRVLGVKLRMVMV